MHPEYVKRCIHKESLSCPVDLTHRQPIPCRLGGTMIFRWLSLNSPLKESPSLYLDLQVLVEYLSRILSHEELS